MVKKIKISSILRRMAVKNAVLIDVLDRDSYEHVHIKNAINIPFDELENEVCDKVPKNTPVITYSNDFFCPVSRNAARKLSKLGYKKVYYYQGGLKEWLEAGMPVEKADH